MKKLFNYLAYVVLTVVAVVFVFGRSDTYIGRTFYMEESTRGTSQRVEITTPPKNENDTSSGDEDETPEETTTRDESGDYDYYYNDGSVRIAITKVKDEEKNDSYVVADVTLSSVDQFLSIFAYGTYGSERQGTKAMAESAGAVFAVSGDYYNVRSGGIVIRNGVLYRNTAGTRDTLVMYENGDLGYIPYGTKINGNDLIAQGVIQAYVFGPTIVNDGEALTKFTGKDLSYIKKTHPRMLMGQIDTLHYVFVAVEGRHDGNDGMTLTESAELMESLGCRIAYNLDGGESSTMVFRGEIINLLADQNYVERPISDCIGILGGDY